MEKESSITYTVALATRRPLGPGQTSVSLLSLLTGGSDQANQTWVTLQDENKCAHTKNSQRWKQCPFVYSNFKGFVCMFDKGKNSSSFAMHMGGYEEWNFITVQILRHYNLNVSAIDKKIPQNKIKIKVCFLSYEVTKANWWLIWSRQALIGPNDLTALKPHTMQHAASIVCF